VMLGHGSTSGHAGRLYRAGTEPVVLTKGLGLSTIQTHLRSKLTNVAGDSDSDGGEEGMYSLGLSMIDNSLFTQSLDFYRADAALAVVFISDENDICAIYPAGVTPVVDPDGKEATANPRDCTNVTPENLYRALKFRKGEKPLLVSSIIYTTNAPAGGENEIGYGYKEITELSQGLKVDMAGDIPGGLASIGALANSQLNLITKHLIKQPGSISKMVVLVDNQSSPFNFDASIREVQLSSPGSAGSRVDINYCIQ
ncbi:MAG: hypothetical protein ABL958_15010, partial [Bdellovibrionia bacterium]